MADILHRVALLRRNAALSKWLKNAAKQQVESNLQAQASSRGSTSTPIQKCAPRSEPSASDEVFTYLIGHQLKKAADVHRMPGTLNA
ncbi:hypothetical protein JOM56_003003 [Amanita muscaria]